jgi:hypothetical protein
MRRENSNASSGAPEKQKKEEKEEKSDRDRRFGRRARAAKARNSGEVPSGHSNRAARDPMASGEVPRVSGRRQKADHVAKDRVGRSDSIAAGIAGFHREASGRGRASFIAVKAEHRAAGKVLEHLRRVDRVLVDLAAGTQGHRDDLIVAESVGFHRVVSGRVRASFVAVKADRRAGGKVLGHLRRVDRDREDLDRAGRVAVNSAAVALREDRRAGLVGDRGDVLGAVRAEGREENRHFGRAGEITGRRGVSRECRSQRGAKRPATR